MEIVPAPRGVPQIHVTFVVDKDAILCLSAVDSSTMARVQVMTERVGLFKKVMSRLTEEMAQCKL